MSAAESMVLEGRYTLRELQELVCDWSQESELKAAGGAFTLAELAGAGKSEVQPGQGAPALTWRALREWQAAHAGKGGNQWKPRDLKSRVRRAIKRNRNALRKALEELLDLGPDGVLIVDKLVCELPNLVGRCGGPLGLSGGEEGNQHANGAADGFRVGNGFELRHGGLSIKVELTSVGGES